MVIDGRLQGRATEPPPPPHDEWSDTCNEVVTRSSSSPRKISRLASTPFDVRQRPSKSDISIVVI